ncbi:MAG: LysM peptidoglycan-binding domain-containing protein [Anaerolineae bacterium]|nr:MAG: LysM peptidoglycan-binding domain-containing protein [Anaerolineae bacterium]
MNLATLWKTRRFDIISWAVTLLIVFGMLAATLGWVRSAATAPATRPEPTADPTQSSLSPSLPPATTTNVSLQAISRRIDLKTEIPEQRPRYKAITYTVARGDSVFAIAKEFGLKPETVLWANYDTLKDDPHSLKPGMVLTIPPTDGIYYQWEEGDTLESVAAEFDADPENILNWPGNDIDLTNPEIKPGEWVMIPGGSREFVQWIIPTVARGSSGTSNVGGSTCPGGAVGSGAFVWPADNHYLSGNDYWSGHLAIDIAAGEGAPVYAADSGVVTMAQGGFNYGYGNVIMIDHGNGYVTLYAHLSTIGVRVCENVYAGQWIGAAGSTGNSTGAHLHFEVRLNGGFVNPWYVLPPP